ncbi:MAG: hypothetical protein JWQ64_2124 [Subtercola sp.]|nr:hypothetical protein [Subtercola sp.]
MGCDCYTLPLSSTQHYRLRVYFNVRLSTFPVEDAVFNSCHSLSFNRKTLGPPL